MPSKVDSLTIKNEFLDRRVKLLSCQKEMIHYHFNNGVSIKSLSKIFKVSKRLIQFELFPERKEKNLIDRKNRGGTSIYYDKDKHRDSTSEHRKYKEKLFN